MEIMRGALWLSALALHTAGDVGAVGWSFYLFKMERGGVKMKRLITPGILVLLVIVVGCAPKQQVRVMYISDPPGGTLYEQTGELWGPCPKVLRYDLDAKALGRGYLKTEGLTVRWPTGPDKESGKLIRITVNGTDRLSHPCAEP